MLKYVKRHHATYQRGLVQVQRTAVNANHERWNESPLDMEKGCDQNAYQELESIIYIPVIVAILLFALL
jgi:hypothetical protein